MARPGPRPLRAAILNNVLVFLVAILVLPAIVSAQDPAPITTCRLWSLNCMGGRDMGCCKHAEGRQFYALSAKCLWGDCYMNTDTGSAECPSQEKVAAAAADAAAKESAAAKS